MLRKLVINNIALIDREEIEFGEGLNILTGETGAGKSIIIDSINAVAGQRITRDLIRTGEEKASVEAVFETDSDATDEILRSMGIEPESDGVIVISREFSSSGKNSCRINGKMATVSMIKQLGEHLIDMHGQYDNQSLLKTESHITLLDSFGGDEITGLKKDYVELYNRYRELKTKINDITTGSMERARKADLLRYQIDEIRNAGLKAGEEEELNKKRIEISNSEKIVSAMSSAYNMLFEGDYSGKSALDSINSAICEINSVSTYHEGVSKIEEKLQDIYYQLEDIASDIREIRDYTEYDPAELEKIEERLDLIFKLKRKYGNTIEKILEYYCQIQSEMEELDNSSDLVEKLQEEFKEADRKLYDMACKLNLLRLKAAQLLEKEIGQVLDDLEMKKSVFKANIEMVDSDGNVKASDGFRNYNQNGLNKVEFLISPNPGEPLKPLSKIASGGEMARIMLAIKTILADIDKIPTLVFDEIDTGISGKAASKVAEKLSYIAKSHQVICVTHLPQIACMADRHYLIRKISNENSTRTAVTHLDKKGIKQEIARLLGGNNISEITLKHADEMIKNAQTIKSAKY